MYDLQHVPNAVESKRLIKDFSFATGLAIALPRCVHRHLKKPDFGAVTNARDLLAMEIWYLRKQTRIPGSVLLTLIASNKAKFTESYRKK